MAADPVTLFKIHNVSFRCFRKVQASAPLLASGACLALPKPSGVAPDSATRLSASASLFISLHVDPSNSWAKGARCIATSLTNFVDSLRSGAEPDHSEPDPQGVADQHYSPTNFSGHKMANGQQHHERFPRCLMSGVLPLSVQQLLIFFSPFGHNERHRRIPKRRTSCADPASGTSTCCAGVHLQNKPVQQTIDQRCLTKRCSWWNFLTM